MTLTHERINTWSVMSGFIIIRSVLNGFNYGVHLDYFRSCTTNLCNLIIWVRLSYD